jgi:hypothetical protein
MASKVPVDECSDEASSASSAARRIVESQLSMYSGSCAVVAVEAWRMWNEFPDQRHSAAMTDALCHFGNDQREVLDEIGVLMSHMIVSPVLDDSFIVRGLLTRSSGHGSSLLRLCLLSALMDKYGESAVRNSDCGFPQNSYTYSQGHTRSCCNSPKLFRDLAAYVTRRRLNAF